MIVYEPGAGIVLIRRRYPPLGWALPGGFVDYGESVEEAARREALEETSLETDIKGLLGVYSDPARDPRRHTISTVFWGRTNNPEKIKGGDDAGEAVFFPLDALPSPLVFDHARIINDFAALLRNGTPRQNAPARLSEDWTTSIDI
jgi:8-oxo-dGTP diphosphatase